MAATTAPVTASQADAPAGAEGKPVIRIGHGELLRAIGKNVQESSVSVQIAGLGAVRLPARDSLVWIGGLATLAAVGIPEWPVAGAIGVGHLLSRQRHLRLVKDFGEALESA